MAGNLPQHVDHANESDMNIMNRETVIILFHEILFDGYWDKLHSK